LIYCLLSFGTNIWSSVAFGSNCATANSSPEQPAAAIAPSLRRSTLVAASTPLLNLATHDLNQDQPGRAARLLVAAEPTLEAIHASIPSSMLQ
jgi:hypothetical protein